MAVGDITRLKDVVGADGGYLCLTDNDRIFVGKDCLFGMSKLRATSNQLYIKRITPNNYLIL